MRVRYLSDALHDYQEALMWHHEHKTGQAAKLSKAISAAVNRIKPDPTSWEMVEDDCRRVPVGKSPYSVIFQVRPADDEIVIVAVSHASRDQGYWRSRIRGEG